VLLAYPNIFYLMEAFKVIVESGDSYGREINKKFLQRPVYTIGFVMQSSGMSFEFVFYKDG